MKRNKIISLMAASALCLALLAGCSGASKPAASEAPKDLLARIKEKGEITIAMEGTWAPWTYHNEAGDLLGYDVEMGKAIADKLGVKPVFVEGEWDGLLAGLAGGRYDLMINGVNVTEERSATYSFSQPYAYDRMVVIVRADDERIQSLDDLKGMSTANTISSIYAEVAREHGANVTGVDDLSQTMELLLQSRIDATLNSELTFLDYMDAQPDSPLKVAIRTDEADPIAIPMPKGDDSATLVEAVDKALSELSQEGKLTELSMKYFGSDISKS